VVDGDNNMRQAARGFAEGAMIAASWWTSISQAAVRPIDKFVDWLEAAYAGPIGPDQSF
jgi:hypothetical protein